MIILDEHIPPSQRHLLRSWRMPVRQIGYDIGRKGMQDDEIIPFLRRLRRPTFFTLDLGFHSRNLCDARYCLAYMNVRQSEVAAFARRLLRHPDFNTQAKRMGAVIRISHAGLSVWRLHAQEEASFDWAA